MQSIRMKKNILTALFFGILFTACENNSGKQKETEVKNTPETSINTQLDKDQRSDSARIPGAIEYLYKSDKGEIVHVSFFEEDGEKFIEVKRDGQPAIVLDQLSASKKISVYEKDNYKWISHNNEATFTNGIYFMKLTVISPLKYTYTNDQEDITIIYFSIDNKRFVTIQKDSLPEITLEQTTAWAKGAEYGSGNVQWHSQRNTGTLIEDGIKTEFKEKD